MVIEGYQDQLSTVQKPTDPAPNDVLGLAGGIIYCSTLMHALVAVPTFLAVSITTFVFSTSKAGFGCAFSLQEDRAVIPAQQTGVVASAEAGVPFCAHAEILCLGLTVVVGCVGGCGAWRDVVSC